MVQLFPLPRFDRLLEETSTINYRFFSIGGTRFLRFHKVLIHDELKCRQLIAEKLKAANVFEEDFADCLKPLKLYSGAFSHKVPHSSLSPAGTLTMELFPYVEGVTHFKGSRLSEIGDVGSLLGRVQQAFQQFDANTVNRLQPLTAANKDKKWPSDEDRKRLLRSISDLEKYGSLFSLLHPYARLLWIEKDDIKKWIEEVTAFQSETLNESPYLLLHDVHPHNVFCKNGKCVLIYDYQWLGFWPHSHVLAFAIHRFVREYART